MQILCLEESDVAIVLQKGVDAFIQKSHVAISVYRAPSEDMVYNAVLTGFVSSNRISYEDDSQLRLTLPAGHYVVVLSHTKLGRPLGYTVSIASNRPFEAEYIKFLSGWEKDNYMHKFRLFPSLSTVGEHLGIPDSWEDYRKFQKTSAFTAPQVTYVMQHPLKHFLSTKCRLVASHLH
uniref:Uncharacterized protein n=1 Tax=Palpitomonas bilix TaxID=652834 RepID=A0A7S3G1T8_9EUKA|mmetsp:Transcript_15121/g.38211  ORF Transcript_15121/g.38211 Transcript_15121/m.38211 type:complete len:178 (+) Transcript_15121:209-742(+)